MRTARHSGQDGFIREVLWLGLIVAVIAIVLLDAMALFNAHQASHDNAASAVREAETEYAQTSSAAQAKAAAQDYLERTGVKLIAFKTTESFDGNTTFAVTTTAHAKTYAFKYLSHVPGLKDWVKQTLNPVSTEGGA
jgi:hypothetical protein